MGNYKECFNDTQVKKFPDGTTATYDIMTTASNSGCLEVLKTTTDGNRMNQSVIAVYATDSLYNTAYANQDTLWNQYIGLTSGNDNIEIDDALEYSTNHMDYTDDETRGTGDVKHSDSVGDKAKGEGSSKSNNNDNSDDSNSDSDNNDGSDDSSDENNSSESNGGRPVAPGLADTNTDHNMSMTYEEIIAGFQKIIDQTINPGNGEDNIIRVEPTAEEIAELIKRKKDELINFGDDGSKEFRIAPTLEEMRELIADDIATIVNIPKDVARALLMGEENFNRSSRNIIKSRTSQIAKRKLRSSKIQLVPEEDIQLKVTCLVFGLEYQKIKNSIELAINTYNEKKIKGRVSLDRKGSRQIFNRRDVSAIKSVRKK